MRNFGTKVPLNFSSSHNYVWTCMLQNAGGDFKIPLPFLHFEKNKFHNGGFREIVSSSLRVTAQTKNTFVLFTNCCFQNEKVLIKLWNCHLISQIDNAHMYKIEFVKRIERICVREMEDDTTYASCNNCQRTSLSLSLSLYLSLSLSLEDDVHLVQFATIFIQLGKFCCTSPGSLGED